MELKRPRGRLALASDAQYNTYRAAVLRFSHQKHSNPEGAKKLAQFLHNMTRTPQPGQRRQARATYTVLHKDKE